MEKSYNLENPWEFSFRGIFLIILGLFSLSTQPNTLAPLILILSLLFLFSSFMSLGETIILKKHKLVGVYLFRFIAKAISFLLMFMGFLAYYNESISKNDARDFAVTAIFVSFLILLTRTIYELISNIKSNPHYSLILVIESVLSVLLVIYFYQIYNELDSLRLATVPNAAIHNLAMFGYFSVGFGIVEIALHRLMVRLKIS